MATKNLRRTLLPQDPFWAAQFNQLLFATGDADEAADLTQQLQINIALHVGAAGRPVRDLDSYVFIARKRIVIDWLRSRAGRGRNEPLDDVAEEALCSHEPLPDHALDRDSSTHRIGRNGITHTWSAFARRIRSEATTPLTVAPFGRGVPIYHPDFRKRPGITFFAPTPEAKLLKLPVPECHMALWTALETALEARPNDAKGVGDDLADVLLAAMSRLPAESANDPFGIYDQLLALPQGVLQSFWNQELTEGGDHA